MEALFSNKAKRPGSREHSTIHSHCSHRMAGTIRRHSNHKAQHKPTSQRNAAAETSRRSITAPTRNASMKCLLLAQCVSSCVPKRYNLPNDISIDNCQFICTVDAQKLLWYQQTNTHTRVQIHLPDFKRYPNQRKTNTNKNNNIDAKTITIFQRSVNNRGPRCARCGHLSCRPHSSRCLLSRSDNCKCFSATH